MRNKFLASALTVSILGVSSAYALPFVTIEAGGIVGADFSSAKNFDISKNSQLSFGAYGRVWLKASLIRIGPYFKWESVNNAASLAIRAANQATGQNVGDANAGRYNNFQYGGVLGIQLLRYFTPYVGFGYSQFSNSELQNTWVLSYGLKFKIPLLPLAIGIEGSWQQPNSSAGKVDLHRVGATLGLQF